MNDYEQRKEARIARYRELAEAHAHTAQTLHDDASTRARAIPFGQPILVGHHSENSDRHYRNRIYRTFERSFEALDKARYYEAKAEAAERNNSISSDDPEALNKVRERLAAREAKQKRMKAANRICRNKKLTKEQKIVKLKAQGWNDNYIHHMLNPRETYLKLGFQSWELSNNNASIRSDKKRVKELEAAAQREYIEFRVGGEESDLVYIEDPQENRVQLVFDDKPEEEVRTLLKKRGFKWSRRNQAWQRHLNSQGIAWAEYVMQELGYIQAEK